MIREIHIFWKTKQSIYHFNSELELKGVPNLMNNFSILKLDFKNASNMIYRERIPNVRAESFPEAYLYVSQAYGSPSYLTYGKDRILSYRGVQQGDPLGPLIFSFVIQLLTSSLSSLFNAWYLDDGTSGGPPDIVEKDLQKIMHLCDNLGLKPDLSPGVISRVVNREKYSEVIFFQLDRSWGGFAPPHPPLYTVSYPRVATIQNLHLLYFFHSFVLENIDFLCSELESEHKISLQSFNVSH